MGDKTLQLELELRSTFPPLPLLLALLLPLPAAVDDDDDDDLGIGRGMLERLWVKELKFFLAMLPTLFMVLRMPMLGMLSSVEVEVEVGGAVRGLKYVPPR